MIENLKFKIENYRRGFTLIEVLAVMAILAILSTIVFVSIGNQRQRARLTGATMAVKSAMTIATTCEAVGGTLNPPTNSNNPGNPICTDTTQISSASVWPQLPDKCHYCGGFTNSTQVDFSCDPASDCDPTTNSFCSLDSAQCVQNN